MSRSERIGSPGRYSIIIDRDDVEAAEFEPICAVKRLRELVLKTISFVLLMFTDSSHLSA